MEDPLVSIVLGMLAGALGNHLVKLSCQSKCMRCNLNIERRDRAEASASTPAAAPTPAAATQSEHEAEGSVCVDMQHSPRAMYTESVRPNDVPSSIYIVFKPDPEVGSPVQVHTPRFPTSQL